MSSKSLRTKYAPEKTVASYFTGNKIQITNDGKYIFCHCPERVTIIETNSGIIVKSIEFEENVVSTIALSPDSTSLAISFEKTFHIQHYKIRDYCNIDPQLVTSFKSYHECPISQMAWDSSSVYLASGDSDGKIRVWEMNKKYCTHSLKDAFGVVSVISFSKNLAKRSWIYGAAGEHIYIWVLEAGSSRLISKLIGHDSAITAIQQTHSDNYLISCGLDKVIILWDLRTFESKKIIPLYESLAGIIIKPPHINFYNVSKKEKEQNIVFTIGSKGIPSIWDVDNGKEMWRASSPIVPIAKNEDAQLFSYVSLNEALNSFVLTSSDNIIYLLNCPSMKVTKRLVGHNEEILDVIFLGETNAFTAVATNSIQLRVYENSSHNCHLIKGHSEIVFALANHPNNRCIFGSGSHDNTARIWRLMENGECECLAIASGHTHSVGALAFGKDFLVTGGYDTCIKRWNFDLNKMAGNKVTHLVSCQTVQAHSKNINSLSLSKNLSLIATCSFDKTAKIWNSKSFQDVGTLTGHRKGIWSVQFSPTDCLVATSSADGTIKLWSLNTYNNVATFEGHEAGVLRLFWISQGQQIVSASSDGVINLWSIKTNVNVGSFDEHDGRVWALAASEDGAQIVTGGSDSKIVWWRDVTEEEKQKELEEKQKLVEEEQILKNLLHEKKWSKALRYSLRLKQPARGLTIMKALLDESPATLQSVLRKLDKDELHTLMEYVVKWNTRTANVREAQAVLNFVLKEYTVEEIVQIPNCQSMLEGLLPYTEKHFKRISALHQAVSILDYMTSCMSIGPMEDEMSAIEEKNLEEEELALLKTIPKEIQKGLITIKNDDDENDTNKHNGDYDDDDEDAEDSEYDDDSEHEIDVPLNSVEDLKSNFTIEEVVSESESDEDDYIESG